jgi:glycosyltransferase involved in cell wall biosynthesis
MSSPLQISVVVSTFERPRHLRRSLLSLAAQRQVDGLFEVIVVDDGSRDETPEVVEQFRRQAPVQIKFCTHPHDGFQLARCRNSGIRAALAPYVLFTDGDCIFPPDHLRRHLDARRPGVVRAGDCIRLDEATSRRIDDEAIRSGRFLQWVDPRGRRALRRLRYKSLGYQWMRHASRPKLVGWNMAMWRDQIEEVNGFDEQFTGWGCEDDDLAHRLRASGARVATALGFTHAFHLWHAPHASTPARWADGANVSYFRRPLVLSRCLDGVRQRSLSQVSIRVVPSDQRRELSSALAAMFHESAKGAEVELIVWPHRPAFVRLRPRRVLVAPQQAALPAAVLQTVDAVIRIGAEGDAEQVRRDLYQLLSPRHATAGDPAPAHHAA